MLIPDSGLPRLAFNVYFLMLLLNTAAANPDRRRLPRSLAVTFGAAFLVKFVILLELSTPGTGWTKRVLQAMLERITLGTLTQPDSIRQPATWRCRRRRFLARSVSAAVSTAADHRAHSKHVSRRPTRLIRTLVAG